MDQVSRPVSTQLNTLSPKSLFPNLGVGLGLRSAHYPSILNQKVATPWFEVISENYLGVEDLAQGRPLAILEKIRNDHEIVLHGVSMSIGSTDPLDGAYLKKLKNLSDAIKPAWISDHLCWTGVEGENLHDLLPFPFTEEVLFHLVDRITQVQDRLGRRMLFENLFCSFGNDGMGVSIRTQ